MSSRQQFIVVVAVLASVLCVASLSGCGSRDDSELDAVSVRMKWFFAGTMTGWFAGADQGFFAEEGIDLTINPGGPDNSAVKLVAAGTDDFGVAGADEVLMAREKGMPVVAIAVLFKESPIAFVAKRESGIESPADWTGKTIEVSYGSNAEVQYRALVSMFDVSGVREVPYTYSLAPFIEDKVDVSVAYAMDQVVTLQRMGIDMNIMESREYGVNPYGDVIITSEAMLRNNPNLVSRFLKAAVRAQMWSIENPEAAVNSLVGAVPDLDADNELDVWNATVSFLVGSEQMQDIGLMRGSRWQETMEELLRYGGLEDEVDLARAAVGDLMSP